MTSSYNSNPYSDPVFLERARNPANPEFWRALGDGLKGGMDVAPEERHGMLRHIRDVQGMDEAPRIHYVLGNNPLVDLAKQVKAVNPEGRIARMLPGISPYDDEELIRRGNAGFLLGPQLTRGEQIKPDASPEVVEAFKEKLRRIPTVSKAGYALGNLAQDFTNNASRNIWWLINAPQAVVDLASESVASQLNPSLFGAERLTSGADGITEAEKLGLIRFSPKGGTAEEQWDRAKKVVDGIQPSPVPPGGTAAGYGQLDPLVFTPEQQALYEDAQDKLKNYKDLLDNERKERNKAENYVASAPGVRKVEREGGKTFFKRRRFNPNLVSLAALLPAATAVNAGIGLLDRQDGYAATVPSDEDPRQTSNAIAEVASRYFLGREGNLLPADDVLLERPDVTRAEYNQYKGYLRDREIDLNPFDDGKINLGGVLKTNPDGIRGVEVQFLGKSLPVNDTLMPVAGALLGTAAGAALSNVGSLRFRRGRLNDPNKKIAEAYRQKISKGNRVEKALGKAAGFIPESIPRKDQGVGERNFNPAFKEGTPLGDSVRGVQRFFDAPDAQNSWTNNVRTLSALAAGGTVGALAAGAIAGALEDERRRRNFAEQYGEDLDYDQYKSNAAALLDTKIRMGRENPNAAQEREQSAVGFSRRNQQAALMDYALEQQSLIDQMAPGPDRERASDLLGKQMWALSKASSIDEEIGARRKQKDEEQLL
ncbi:hypothetical protein SynBIOSE41_00857 [Synechococcus sp. BIOS-E4-1]|uniref:hypothetical protein n=1 Tax=Synechococcus sp. BIOS-E4-1 TaxID=1400864 RepID=UPI001644A5B1|nr:hypothetical protein [Synechococcus sp. BIOS-E4-1]QNI53389.1 hypothetical protein SynBIOSE41_00857 [Synechococcus sp. BIOS-E4-1]